jgi:hypothetical protein
MITRRKQKIDTLAIVGALIASWICIVGMVKLLGWLFSPAVR